MFAGKVAVEIIIIIKKNRKKKIEGFFPSVLPTV